MLVQGFHLLSLSNKNLALEKERKAPLDTARWSLAQHSLDGAKDTLPLEDNDTKIPHSIKDMIPALAVDYGVKVYTNGRTYGEAPGSCGGPMLLLASSLQFQSIKDEE
jgi:hypothetical protein